MPPKRKDLQFDYTTFAWYPGAIAMREGDPTIEGDKVKLPCIHEHVSGGICLYCGEVLGDYA